MKKPVMSLFALTVIASVFSCNTETSNAAPDKDSASQNQQPFDTGQTTNAKNPTETTVSEPTTPQVEDHTFNKVLSFTSARGLRR